MRKGAWDAGYQGKLLSPAADKRYEAKAQRQKGNCAPNGHCSAK